VVFRPLRTEFQAVVHLDTPARASVGIALCRSSRDFTDADKAALARLQPFLQSRYSEARQRHLVRLLLDGRPEPMLLEALGGLGLSEREAEACVLMVKGLSNHEIGAALGISPLTVKTHCERLFAKLGASGRVDTARRAIAALLRMPGIRSQKSDVSGSGGT
jgi:DNA-binding CsgD family transcriptional regulator